MNKYGIDKQKTKNIQEILEKSRNKKQTTLSNITKHTKICLIT